MHWPERNPKQPKTCYGTIVAQPNRYERRPEVTYIVWDGSASVDVRHEPLMRKRRIGRIVNFKTNAQTKSEEYRTAIRLMVAERGWVHSHDAVKQLKIMGTVGRGLLDQVLARMVKDGELQRIERGLYATPRVPRKRACPTCGDSGTDPMTGQPCNTCGGFE